MVKYFLIFSGWDNINMVLKREGKTLELKLRVSCGSWPEDGMQLILCWKNSHGIHYSYYNTATISKDFRILQIKFLRQRCPEKEPHSFSLIYKNGERSLDLVCSLQCPSHFGLQVCSPFFLTSTIFLKNNDQICSDRDQAENWYLGLRALLPTPCNPCSSIESRSSRQIDSCTNTPSSYIQLKSRLLSVHGTPRHIQVSSGSYIVASEW